MKFPVRLFSFILLFLAFFLFLKPAFAQTPATNTDPGVPDNLHTWTQNVVIEVASSMSCLISGIDPINPRDKCLGIDINTHKIGYVEKDSGAVGFMGNLIAMTFDIPVHTADYVTYLADNFGVTKPTYAAPSDGGVGFKSLKPLTAIWIEFRNITYLLLVLVFVGIGFAIMLRVHIDPRTVMSIENQVPKIVVALILITFSFAIAGFLIDLMWVFVYLVIGVFSNIPGVSIGTAFSNVQGLNALQVANNLPGGILSVVNNSSGGVGGFISGLFDGPGGRFFATILMSIIGAGAGFIVGGVGAIVGGLASAALGLAFGSQLLGFLGSVVAFLIIGIAVLWALFRLWFQLIKAYVMILVVIVFSPFWILLGIIPGSKMSFTSLLRELGANLITYPATIVMFLLGTTFMDLFGKTRANEMFVPPLIGSPATPSAIGSLVGLGIILLTPEVNKMMRKALQAPEFDLTGIVTATGVGVGALTAGVPGVQKIGASWLASRTVPAGTSGTALGRVGRFIGYMRSPGTPG